MKNSGEILKEIISAIKPKLLQICDEESSIKPTLNKWSKKEIIGHLIDSAANNHQRFVRANFQNNLIFNGFAQEKWVALQNYQHADWNSLINFWYYYNSHLAVLIDYIPAEIKNKLHSNHSLDKIAWKTVPKSTPINLDYFIKDYIGHLENHLLQIFPDYVPRMIGKY